MSTQSLELARTFLFVPGDRPDRFDKALAVGADQVIVDLEDAVTPDKKDSARASLKAWLDPARPVIVRINAADTPYFAADVETLNHPGVTAVVLAKAEDADIVSSLPVPVLPLIETACGMKNLDAICAAENTVRTIFGTIDFMVDIGVPHDGEGLNAFRSQMVLASRLAGLAAPVDGVTAGFDDIDLITSDTHRALAYGFSGRICIHPKQVTVIHAAMRPDEKTVAWAKRVVAAAQASNGAAVQLDGEMIDKPVIMKAEGILKRA